MSQNKFMDLLPLLEELQNSKIKLRELENKSEAARLALNEINTAMHAEFSNVNNLASVLNYCVEHDVDPAYAKLALSLSDSNRDETLDYNPIVNAIKPKPRRPVRSMEMLEESSFRASSSKGGATGVWTKITKVFKG